MRSGVEVRFQAETAEFVQRHHLGRAWANLDQIFVSPLLIVPPQDIEEAPPSDYGASQLNYIWPDLAAGIATPMPQTISLRQLLLTGRRTLVSAPPGSGKTTLLAYGAYQCASATSEGIDVDLFSLVPLFVHLAELHLPTTVNPAEEKGRMPEDPAASLVAALQKRHSPITSSGIKSMVSRKLKAGQLLLLLDGWDELAAADRPTVALWLSQLLDAYPETQVVVAAALTGYGPLLALDFTLVGLLPWHAGQVEAFAVQWTKAFPLSQPPHQGYYWRPGQSSLENSLRFWLAAASPGSEANGLEAARSKRKLDMMTLSVPLFTGDSHNSGEEAAGPELRPPALRPLQQITLTFWQKLAYTLVTEGKLSLTQPEIAALLAETLAEQGHVERGEASRLQKDISKCSLFIKWPDESVSFSSAVWRDFFAADYLAERRLVNEAAVHLTDPDWASILRFYVGRAGATELATELLATKEQGITRDALFQVASWMAEAPDGGEWRRQTMILLGQIIRQVTFPHALRQRAAAAMAQTGEQGVFTFLSQLLERSDPFLRHTGTAALSGTVALHGTTPQSPLGSEKTLELITSMLEDGDGRVRQMAVSTLAWLPHQLTERPLLMALINGDDQMSCIAAEGLARRGKEGVEILREAIEDEDLTVRRAAVRGLALLDGEWVAPLLSKVEREDSEWLVKAAATEALERIKLRENPPPWQPLPISEQRWLVQHAAQEGRVVPKGEATLPFLVQILTESSLSKLRVAAAASLGQITAKEALPALETAARDADKQVSNAAFTTLCLIRRAYGEAPSLRPPL